MMRDMERIARLVAMVCMALVWAYLVGEHKDINIKPIRILKHGRKAKSLVKYGLEEISTILLRPAYTPKIRCFQIFVIYLMLPVKCHGIIITKREGADKLKEFLCALNGYCWLCLLGIHVDDGFIKFLFA